MSEHKTLRVSAETAAAIREAAEREGVSQSDIIRTAVEARLGVSEPEPDPDIYRLVALAAKGSLSAQRDICRIALAEATRHLVSGDTKAMERSFVEALNYAHLAAAHGNMGDQGAIFSILALMEKHCPEMIGFGDIEDMLGRLDFVTDRETGESAELTADALSLLVSDLAPEHAADCLAGAKYVRERLQCEMGGGA